MKLEIRNPATGDVVAAVDRHDDSALDSALGAAVSAYEGWRRVPIGERVERVRACLDWFRVHEEDVAVHVTRQMGKPLAQARGEVTGLLQRAEHMCDIAEDALAPDRPPADEGFELAIEHAPLGVVFNLAAWNYPLLIPVNVVAPALLAGNSVLLKHSAITTLCGTHFEEAFAPLGPGLVTNVVCDHDACARLIADERVAHVAFTGSVEGGRAVNRAAAERFIDVGLELGGKDPAYVAADADLEFTVPNVVEGALYNAGQSCCAIERVYVHASVADEFVERAKTELAKWAHGDPELESTTLGPLAQAKAIPFLEAQVKDAVERGATLACGGERVDERYFPSTLLTGCPNDSDVMQEESFGPILPVLTVADDDEALARMNETRFGLTASIWTRDVERARRIASGHDTGTFFLNRCDYLDPKLPWTGVGDSGRGSTLSRYGFFHLTRRKAFHFRMPG